MQLSDVERSMLDGARGEAVRRALEMQISVGKFFGAERFVPVSSVHMMGDIEVMGESGARLFADLLDEGASFVVPVTTNSRCVDFDLAGQLRQDPEMVSRERDLQRLQSKMGAMMVNTCINYQTLYQPHLGEHIAWGDTGTVVYANSVLGARSNYESGPAALAAGLTGRTPAYGFHLDEQRLGTIHVRVAADLRDWADWGALGAVVGRQVTDYWAVPVIDFERAVSPSADDLKHLGTSIASYGSTAMFHLVGCTPEAPTRKAAFGGREPTSEIRVHQGDIDAVFDSYPPLHEDVELVVFSGPQLSLFELREIAAMLDGRKVSANTHLIVTTNMQNWAAAKRLGYVAAIEAAGGIVSHDTCWYIMAPGKMGQAFGWQQVVTNSAKLANIVGGYRYRAVLRRTADCIEAAVRGSLSR